MGKKFILGISGASGVQLAQGFLAHLPKDFSVHIIISRGVIECAKYELGLDSKQLESTFYTLKKGVQIWRDDDIGAPVASGSFGAEAMAIIPTSMDTLAKIACGISDTLLTRTASVMIKERKTLLLAPREMPLNAIACEHLHKLAMLQVIIAPPIIAYYSYPKNLQEMERFLYGKWLDILQIPNNLYTRWGEQSHSPAKQATPKKSGTKPRQKGER
ncbi:UbiX family flavin prenyltransferase [uncultured Helicobacter sp.]|uniref:UbiX family flavin prenyltransferase n=1 Tax=uncultured Helicobacter sp. TaxID=175537 RepID=UPI002628A54A|nr:UbiX family flavin prenyltransferase [uncultured Helicobacter sp.]